jgi:polyhydroxyalkanoate synthesis regulator protein
VLTQIIVDQESRMGSQTLLPIPFLRQLIRFYGDSIERLVPSYLQASLDTLTKEQERFRKSFAGAFTAAGAFEAYQEQARKNLAMFEQAMKMFSPFAHIKAPGEDGKKAEGEKPAGAAVGPSGGPSGGPVNEIAELKAELANMQRKLDKLAGGSG